VLNLTISVKGYTMGTIFAFILQSTTDVQADIKIDSNRIYQ